MLNPYEPPNDPTPLPKIDRRTTRYFSIWLLATLTIAGSTISASTLVAIHHLALVIARPPAAIGSIVIVMVIQVFSSAQIARQSKIRTIYVSQCIVGLSWLAFPALERYGRIWIIRICFSVAQSIDLLSRQISYR
jgi:hypothetical protein